jgi:hypothetical protein
MESILMRRILGPVLAIALMMSLGSRVVAQVPEDDLRAGSVYRGPGPFNEPYGGFGFGYTQVLPSNSYVFDRYWNVVQTPSVGSTTPDGGMTPSVASEQPAAPVQRVAKARTGRPARLAARAAARSVGRKSYQAAVQPPAPLPSGSLYWPGAAGASLYSPALRSGTYGWGYGVSSYGSIDYGSSYKGYYWGY